MYCIGFNGPPRTGKDSLAFEIDRRFDLTVTATLVRSLSMPLRKVAFAMIDRPYAYSEYERVKDEAFEIFNGETLRRFMIRYSEEFAKSIYGPHVWANSLLAGLGTSIHLPGLCLVPDIGFQPETDRLVDAFGPDRFLLVRLSRRDTDWSRDSRSYVDAPNWVELYNGEGKLESTAASVLDHCEQLGWEL